MAKKETMYAVGSVICVVAIGAVVFYLVKANKTNVSSSTPAVAAQSQVAALEPSQQIAEATSANGGNAAAAPVADSQATQGAPRGNMPNIPAGSKPFFGQVASINGDTVTITSMSRRGGSANGDPSAAAATTAASAPTTTTVSVTLTGSTVFSGGTKDAIVSGVRLFGYGTTNADGSITATNIQINPTRPAGGAGGGWQNHADPTSSATE